MADHDGLFPETFDPICFRDASWADRVDLWVREHLTGFAGGNVEVAKKVLADEVTGLRMVVNITADALLGFMREGRYRRLRRLSDKLFLAMTDSEYFGYNPGYAELAPIALMAMLSVPDDRYVAAGVEPEIVFQDRLRDALEWLARELPIGRLPDAAEGFLNQYARSMLESSEDR